MENAPVIDRARVKELRAAARQALQQRSWGRARDLLDEALELLAAAAPAAGAANISSGSGASSTSGGEAALLRLRVIASAGLADFESALEDADALLELRPGPDAYMYRGHALYHLRDYAGAARAFHQGLKASPRDKLMQQGFFDALTMMRQEQPVGANGGGGGSGFGLPAAGAATGGARLPAVWEGGVGGGDGNVSD